MAYVYLTIAILFEVLGTMLLPLSQNFTKLYASLAVAACYMSAIFLMTFSLKTLPIAIVYATWSGMGIFLIAVLSYYLYAQALQWQAILGLGFIIFGVSLVNIYAKTH